MTKSDDAAALFKSGFNCSQSVLTAFGPSLGLDRDRCLRVAASFGGGMGRMGKTCGAVTGAFMVIGLKNGAVRSDDAEAKKRTYALVNKFAEKFLARNKSLECKDLLGCDLSTEAGVKEMMAKDLHNTVCPKFIRDAAEILEEMLK